MVLYLNGGPARRHGRVLVAVLLLVAFVRASLGTLVVVLVVAVDEPGLAAGLALSAVLSVLAGRYAWVALRASVRIAGDSLAVDQIGVLLPKQRQFSRDSVIGIGVSGVLPYVLLTSEERVDLWPLASSAPWWWSQRQGHESADSIAKLLSTKFAVPYLGRDDES